MRASIKQSLSLATLSCDAIVVPFFSNKKLTRLTRTLDKTLGNKLASLLKSDQDFSAGIGEVINIPLLSEVKATRIILWGLGETENFNRNQWTQACDALANSLLKSKVKHCAFALDFKTNKQVATPWFLQQLSIAIVKKSYTYTQTKSSNKKKIPPLNKLTYVGIEENASNRRAVKSGISIGKGVNIAKELGNLPANICTPRYLSSEARALGRKANNNISTSVLNEKQMHALGMHSLLSVGNGSDEPSQFIIMNYKGGKASAKPYVLVGKGITFDTGGISLKPGAKMDEMKFDMCGAATVMGVMNAVSEMQLPINIIGVIAAAENMPSGRATKPGDVVTSMSGKTIEILNTDAEGRLVLCDALTYVKRFKPEVVVDMATLTGACIVALGHHATGLLSNDDNLADDLLNAGIASCDRAWRLPIWDEYQKQLNSPFADLANIGGPAAGTITAACFLSQFAEDYPWAHLDIAGTAWNQGGGKSASGRPVALLCQYLMNAANKAF